MCVYMYPYIHIHMYIYIHICVCVCIFKAVLEFYTKSLWASICCEMILPFLTASSWLITQITRCLSVYDSWLQPNDSQPPAFHEQARLDCDVKRRKSITVGRWKGYCHLSWESTSGRWRLFYIPSSALCFKRATRYTLLLSEPNI